MVHANDSPLTVLRYPQSLINLQYYYHMLKHICIYDHRISFWLLFPICNDTKGSLQ